MSGQAVATPQVQLGFQGRDVTDAEKGKSRKTPRRTIYFQDGDELEEYSTEEEEEIDQMDISVQRMASMDWKSLRWSSYLFNIGVFGFLKAFKSLEYAGEVLSYKLGITAPKYQSEIEEASRLEAEEEEERKRAAIEDASWNAGTTTNERDVAPMTSGTPIHPHRLYGLMPSPVASSTPIL